MLVSQDTWFAILFSFLDPRCLCMHGRSVLLLNRRISPSLHMPFFSHRSLSSLFYSCAPRHSTTVLQSPRTHFVLYLCPGATWRQRRVEKPCPSCSICVLRSCVCVARRARSVIERAFRWLITRSLARQGTGLASRLALCEMYTSHHFVCFATLRLLLVTIVV